jgi:hypothetical protein
MDRIFLQSAFCHSPSPRLSTEPLKVAGASAAFLKALHAAYVLDPKNVRNKRNYERLFPQANQ